MKKRILIVIAVCMTMMTAMMGCKSAEQRNIDRMETIVEKAETQGDTYSAEDWEVAISRFESALEKIETSDKKLTSEQLKEIGRLTARMAKVTTKYYFGVLTDVVSDKAQELSGFLEEWSSEDIEEDFDNLLNDLENLFSE